MTSIDFISIYCSRQHNTPGQYRRLGFSAADQYLQQTNELLFGTRASSIKRR
jgi:hypothetical protein